MRDIKGGSTIGTAKREIDQEKRERVIEILKKDNIDEMISNFFPRRSEVFWILLDIVKSKEESTNRRIAAARSLGELGLDHNLNVLIDNFFLGCEKGKSFEELNWSNFPVGFALIKTSASSARLNLLNKIKLARDEEMIRLCAFVLMKIEDKDVAKFILEQEIKKETVTSQKEKLEKALFYLE
ncbi:MAG: hypothetical protein HY761_07455 [Candidatus Omnitrophica bacterium]|nr:hypothetical protein [Candidatus Omnitrophota bacterium]